MKYFALCGKDGDLHDLCDCGDVEAAYASAEDMDLEPVWVLTASEAVDWARFIVRQIDVPCKSYLLDAFIDVLQGDKNEISEIASV